MNIEFIKIEVQNFKSIGEMVTFNFKDLKGLNFIYGKNLDVPNAKNGSGKTSLCLDSLVFALFGKTLKNTNNKYIPNRLVSEKLKPYCKVYLRSDGQLYSCETYGRVVAGNMSTIGIELLKLDEDYHVIEDLTQSSVNKTKQYVQENILGCTFSIFKSSIVISSADFMNFYEGMGKDQKRKYVETIFNLDCFGDMFSMIKSDINDTKKEMTSCKNDILKLSDSIKDITEKFNNFNETLTKKRELIGNKIREKVKEIKSLQFQKKDITVSPSDELNKKKTDLKNRVSELTTAKIKLDKLKMKNELEIKHINSMISEMKKISEGLCEKCTKLMNDRYDYDNKQADIEKMNKSIDTINIKLDLIDKELSKDNDILNDLNKEIKDNDAISRKFNQLEMNIKFLVDEVKTLKDQYDDVKEGTTNPFKSILDNENKSFQIEKERLTEFNKNKIHLDVLKDACSENGIKRFIMKDIVKLLNSLIQKYLNEIGCEFMVYFDETFDFKFLTSSGECDFTNFSAGERQRIQIATILAFRDLILNGKISSNILIIDELLDANIDTVCIENVMKILKRKSVESHQNIFIISHRSELADNESIWDNVIKITKENGQSTYEIK